MTHSITVEPLFFGPLTPDWTIRELLDWIGADDDRCHDEPLAGILDAAARAVGAEPLAPGVGVVARVRLLASCVAADPAVGERTLDGVVSGGDVGSVARSAEESGVLVRV